MAFSQDCDSCCRGFEPHQPPHLLFTIINHALICCMGCMVVALRVALSQVITWRTVMPTPSRTYQKASGMFYMRLLIPKHLVSHTTKSKLIYSLGTKNRHDAYIKALKINLHFEEWISKMSNDSKRFPALIVELGNGAKVDFNMSIPAEKDAYFDLLENIGRISPSESKAATTSKQRFKLEDELKQFIKVKGTVYAKATFHSYVSRTQAFIDYAKARKLEYVDEIDSEIAIMYRNHLIGPEVSPLTVDNHTKAIKQYFDQIIKDKHSSADNPFACLHIVKKSQKIALTNSYIPFRPEELERLFNYSVYAKRFNKPDLFYSPLMALTMGFRLEEIAQLRVSDIYQTEEEGVWVVDINARGPYKQLKTPGSARIMPLPKSILSTNFLDYHQYITETYGVASHLYPYLTKTKNGYGKSIGYNFTQYKKALIQIDPELKTFHSLRKNIGAYMQTPLDYQMSLRKHILGHLNTDITDTVYGADTPRSVIRDKLDQLVYKQIDFSVFQFDFRKGNLVQKLMRAMNDRMIRTIV